MANTMTIQEVLAVFKRFSEDVRLIRLDGDDWMLSLECIHGGVGVMGRIVYPYELVYELDQHPLSYPTLYWPKGSISIKFSLDTVVVYSEKFQAENGGADKSLLDFIRETDKPLRQELYRTQEAAWRRETGGQERLDVEKKLRKLMR